MAVLALRKIQENEDFSAMVEKMNYNFEQISLSGGGPSGDEGLRGKPGIVGPPGRKGDKGDQGIRGTLWFLTNNSTVPGGGVTDPIEGDVYLNYVTGELWTYTSSVWIQTNSSFLSATGSSFLSVEGTNSAQHNLVINREANKTVLLTNYTDSYLETVASASSPSGVDARLKGILTDYNTNVNYRFKVYATSVSNNNHLNAIHLLNTSSSSLNAYLRGFTIDLQNNSSTGSVSQGLIIKGNSNSPTETVNNYVRFKDTSVEISGGSFYLKNSSSGTTYLTVDSTKVDLNNINLLVNSPKLVISASEYTIKDTPLTVSFSSVNKLVVSNTEFTIRNNPFTIKHDANNSFRVLSTGSYVFNKFAIGITSDDDFAPITSKLHVEGETKINGELLVSNTSDAASMSIKYSNSVAYGRHFNIRPSADHLIVTINSPGVRSLEAGRTDMKDFRVLLEESNSGTWVSSPGGTNSTNDVYTSTGRIILQGENTYYTRHADYTPEAISFVTASNTSVMDSEESLSGSIMINPGLIHYPIIDGNGAHDPTSPGWSDPVTRVFVNYTFDTSSVTPRTSGGGLHLFLGDLPTSYDSGTAPVFPLYINNQGLVFIDTTSTSSLNTKENITPLTFNMENFYSIEAIKYNRIGNSNIEIGVTIEQLVNLGLTDVLRYNNETPYAVNYDRLSIYMIEVLKSQKSEIESLKQRINTLENAG